ncbi:DNA cytosine methyltransferase [Pseudonocardia alaniniphila]|uniref:DNA (cytosine-5-)-methyltransferase n=1 Tax=Pseudonocardia alaniniphila TaxID=75291 RepID=A0ABS9TV95_9PSEU|nr:DNA (cytosine-5-)-methyltransferase [Pseudonocardia alaniniphila]MCH6172283.1 DNA (cytosine-5-)-methyltransferase [Pseudonocardia alaniniphila]
MSLNVVEICAGAGGQALGLEQAGFEHELAVELDANACRTLRENRPSWKVAEGDVADPEVWNPADYEGVSLLAGGVPCPPFTIAGKQLGATDERDLFAWAVELAATVQPRALLLENVRGLSMPRFAGYRQHVLDRLAELNYIGEWKLLQASDYSVPQLRPRFVLVALRAEDAPYFTWPEPSDAPPSVGETLLNAMAADGWEGAAAWARKANRIAPTIVGGSKKHGGADLGPTRAKRAWAELGVDALGVADNPPQPGDRFTVGPKLTAEMVALIQGWKPGSWKFSGRKTAKYRQIGNAFPPPVAAAVGHSIRRALEHDGLPTERVPAEHDPIYKVLRTAADFLTRHQIERAIGTTLEASELERRISLLSRDFDLQVRNGNGPVEYKLGSFRAFLGQQGHLRNELFQANRSRIS